MPIKKHLLLVFLSVFTCSGFSQDTIRFELVTLENIRIDTLVRLDHKSFLGSANLQFRKGADSLIHLGFVQLMGTQNSSVMYYWTKQSSPANFTLTKGLMYKIQLIPLCKSELDSDCFYAKYSIFKGNNCVLNKLFNNESFSHDGDYSRKLFHYMHNQEEVFKVLYFYPSVSSETKKGPQTLNFIPIKLGK